MATSEPPAPTDAAARAGSSSGERGDDQLHNGVYDIQTLGTDDQGLARYRRIFDRNDDPRNPAVLDWRHGGNPASATSATAMAVAVAGGVNTEADDASIYHVMGVPFWAGSSPVDGVQAVDLLTDANHRRQGLFPLVAEHAFAAGARQGAALVYGFPNGAAIKPYIMKLGWTILDPVPFLIKPLRAGYFAKRLLPGWLRTFGAPDMPLARIPRLAERYTSSTVERFGADYDKIWTTFRSARPNYVGVDRTARYMNWRLLDYPAGGNYRVRSVQRDGRPVGYVAWTVEAKHGGRIGYVLEMVYDPADADAGNALAGLAVRDMIEQNCDAALAWCCSHSPNYAAYRAGGFFPMPEKLRPIELHWGVRSLSEPADESVCKRENWYLSYLDSDTV